jgi:hypothetical protein
MEVLRGGTSLQAAAMEPIQLSPIQGEGESSADLEVAAAGQVAAFTSDLDRTCFGTLRGLQTIVGCRPQAPTARILCTLSTSTTPREFGGENLGRSRQSLILGLVSYSLFLIFVALTYTDYGVSWDEPFYIRAAQTYIPNFFAMDGITETIEDFHLQSHGGLIDALYYFPLVWTGQVESFESLHLLKALASSLVLILVYLILYRIEPDSIMPAVGVLCLIFFPPWLGASFDNHMDGSATLLYAVLMTMALWAPGLRMDLSQSTSRTALRMVGFASVAAISCSHRSSLLTVPGAYFLLLLFQVTDRNRLIRLFWSVVSFSVVFYLVLVIVDPYVRLHWATGLFEKLYHSTSPGRVADLWVTFGGRAYLAAALPRSYLVTWIMISAPSLTLFLVAVGVVRMGVRFGSDADEKRWLEAAFVLLTLFVPILIVLAVHPVLFAAWRHFLFLSVPIAVIAALGLGWVTEILPGIWSRLPVLVFVVGLALIGNEMRKLHPYETLYINRFAGGLQGIEGRYETDYWARSYKEATEWLRNRVEESGAELTTVYVCGPTRSASYYFSEEMTIHDDFASADAVICFTRKDFSRPEEEPDHVVARDGVALTRVWVRSAQLQGRGR